MTVNDNPYSEYFQWQSRLLSFYKKNKSDTAFCDKLLACHPTDATDKRLKNAQKYVKGRINYYNRKTYVNSKTYRYTHTPGLGDLYAICKAQNISPNDALLAASLDHRPDDLYHLLKQMPSGNSIFQKIKIYQKDFQFFKKLPDDPLFLLAFQTQIQQHFCLIFQYVEAERYFQPSARCICSFPTNDTTTKTWIKEICKILERHLRKSASADLYVYNKELTATLMDGQQFEYDFTNNKFDGFDYSQFRQWSVKKHFLAAISSFLLFCSIKVLVSIVTSSTDARTVLSIPKACLTYFKHHPSTLGFMSNLLLRSFIVIDENTIIDTCGYSSYDPSLPEDEEYREEFYPIRGDMDDSRKTDVAQKMSIPNQYNSHTIL